MSDGVVRSLKSAIISPSNINNIIEKEEIVNSFMENEKVSEDEIKEEISSFVLDCLDIKDNINQKASYLYKNGGLLYTNLIILKHFFSLKT